MKNIKKKQPKSGKREIFEWLISILVAVIIAFFLKTFVFTVATISGESMEPTLFDNEKVYVHKFLYKPKKGDIVTFFPEFEDSKAYIKRVIATEGDKIFIDFAKGKVYLNGLALTEGYIEDPTTLSEKFTNDLMENSKFDLENPFLLEKNKVFVMGDNRSKSFDSRGFGPIDIDVIKGRAIFLLWPFSRLGIIR